MVRLMSFKKINPTGYTGLAEAKIRRYNNEVKDYEREVRLKRGDKDYAKKLVSDKIPYMQKKAIHEMIAHDTRKGRRTDLKKVFI